MKHFPELPVYHHLNEIKEAFSTHHTAVISAEPGAGKTMLIPVLLRELSASGMVILVEPRRIAARTAAYGIAQLHDFTVGKETGFAVRGENCRCQNNGILCTTPGILLQMLQHDPLLENVSAIVFDEFHERSLESDLALALTLDMRDSVRDDLLLGIMSATMESERIAEFIHAPLISVPGRGFPVEISYLDTPNDLRELPKHIVRAVLANLNSGDGHILVFLPGADHIRKCQDFLASNLPANFLVCPLHGSLSLAEQRHAIAAVKPGIRKIILATNVAESSLTVDNVCCVIDSGWEKRASWSNGAQMSFLEVSRISKASAVQRAGRAGRTAPGIAIRCYSKLTFENFTDHLSPEIMTSELSSLLLTAAVWGTPPDRLRFPDPPPQAALDSAAETLKKLSLLTGDLRPTPAGKMAALLPVSPRLGAMMIFSPESLRTTAAELAAILEEKDDFMHFDTVDLNERLHRLHSKNGITRIQKSIISRLLKEFPPASPEPDDDAGVLIALAFPEWIGRNRSAGGTVFQLVNGSAASLKEDDFMRKNEFIAVARVDGTSGANSTIRLAMPLHQATIESFFGDKISEVSSVTFDPVSEKPVSFMEKRLGELVLNRRPCRIPRSEFFPALLKEAARREIPLPPADDKRASALIHRLRFAVSCGIESLPDVTNIYSFLASIAEFYPDNINSLNDLRKADHYTPIRSSLDWKTLDELDRFCPEFFIAPSGHKFPIDYSGEQPAAGVIIQELYPLDHHPCIGKNRIPLKLQLLSPARRPVQVTSDLPGFWKGSWELVRAEMKSRYPKHFWPQHPELESARKK